MHLNRDHASFRDYVIKAFNENLPYDRFVIEQLAGDLLPEAKENPMVLIEEWQCNTMT